MIYHRIPINYLLVNLAVADAMYAIFVTPQTFLKIIPTHPGGAIGTVLCKLITGGSFAWTGGTSSVVTLVAIAAERYFAVLYPTGNVGKLTKRKLKVRRRRRLIITISIYQTLRHWQSSIITISIYQTGKSFFHAFRLATQFRKTQAIMKRTYKKNDFYCFIFVYLNIANIFTLYEVAGAFRSIQKS